MRLFNSFVFFVIFVLCFVVRVKGNDSAVVLIILNGLSIDLFKHMKNVPEFFGKGLSGFIQSPFPIESDPFAFSVATGLKPVTHGVVSNHFYDRTHGSLTYKDEQFFRYKKDIKPIWSIMRGRAMCVGVHGSELVFNSDPVMQGKVVID